MSLLQAYVQQFQPGVFPAFLHDRPIDREGSEGATLSRLAQLLLTSHNHKILQFADRRKSEGSSIQEPLEYMAAHAWYMDDPLKALIGLPALVPRSCKDFDTIIMVGGPAERIFWDARQYLLQTDGAHTQWTSLQVLTAVGRRPTYCYIEGEPLITTDLPSSAYELLHLYNNPDVRRDLIYLLIAAGHQNYSILNHRDAFDPSDWDALQFGWDRLLNFFRAAIF